MVTQVQLMERLDRMERRQDVMAANVEKILNLYESLERRAKKNTLTEAALTWLETPRTIRESKVGLFPEA